MTDNRIFNFAAGPCTLPLAALQRAQAEFTDYQGLGAGIVELSHRSKAYDAVHEAAIALLKELLGLGDDWHVLFVGGGASTQFYTSALNFLKPGEKADYVNTGNWSKKAIKEAKRVGDIAKAGCSEEANFTYLPEVTVRDDAKYVHFTSNNTVYGTEWGEFPDTKGKPLVVDMSSDIMARPFDKDRICLAYAGAQKNLGPAGLTVVLLRQDAYEWCKDRDDLPTMLHYKTHVEKNSLFNTPPVFAIYIMRYVLEWVKENGGLAGMVDLAKQRAKLVYDAIDRSEGFYLGTVKPEHRSNMNLNYRLGSEDLDKEFISGAEAHKLMYIKGYRTVGGIRASMYNAMPLAGAETLATYMDEFRAARA